MIVADRVAVKLHVCAACGHTAGVLSPVARRHSTKSEPWGAGLRTTLAPSATWYAQNPDPAPVQPLLVPSMLTIACADDPAGLATPTRISKTRSKRAVTAVSACGLMVQVPEPAQPPLSQTTNRDPGLGVAVTVIGAFVL